MTIEIDAIEERSAFSIDIHYTANGEQHTLALEYDDAAELREAINDNPEAADYYARLAIENEEANV